MTDVLSRQADQLPPQRFRGAMILGIGTAAPPTATQEEVIALAERFSCRTDGQRAWLKRIFLRSGVERRGSVLKKGEGIADAQAFYQPPEMIGEHGPTTATRMERYSAEAPPLVEMAASSALRDAGIEHGAITHLITLSCTGFFAPGLDSELIGRLGLRPDVRRLHLGFMGCHAMFNGLAAARDICRADPLAVVLVASVELCTLHFAYGWKPERLIANALFADGASAAVAGMPGILATEDESPQDPLERGRADGGGRWRLAHFSSVLIPQSREAMTWRIGDHGFEMTLSAELPAIIAKHIRPWCDRWLAEAGLTVADIRRWAIHPGGPRIVASAARALELSDADVAVSHEVLSRHGNMSSATLLFLLEQLGKSPGAALEESAGAALRGGGLCVAIGFGPGLMAEGMLLQWE